MRTACLLHLRPGKEAAYQEAHQHVWPELIQAANAAGFRNHSIFLRERILFVYLEADDLEAAGIALLASEVKQRWDKYMSEYLEEGSDLLKEVFYMP